MNEDDYGVEDRMDDDDIEMDEEDSQNISE